MNVVDVLELIKQYHGVIVAIVLAIIRKVEKKRIVEEVEFDREVTRAIMQQLQAANLHLGEDNAKLRRKLQDKL